MESNSSKITQHTQQLFSHIGNSVAGSCARGTAMACTATGKVLMCDWKEATGLGNMNTTWFTSYATGNFHLTASAPDGIVEAFKVARPNSLKDVRVLFIGAAADEQRVREAVAPSSADFVFVEAK